MEAETLSAILREFGPTGVVIVFALWALVKKDAQCNALMDRLTALTEQQVKTSERVTAVLDSIREAIRQGTGR